MVLGLQHLPNSLTLLRIVLVVPFVWYMVREQYDLALWVLLVAGITDGIDGLLARACNWRTQFGSIADPVADKILMISAYLTLGITGHMEWWVAAAVVARDIYIFIGAIVYWFVVKHYEGSPTWLSKLCTCLMVVLGLTVLANLTWPLVPAALVHWFGLLVVALCVVSMVQYTGQFIQGYRARQRGAVSRD